MLYICIVNKQQQQKKQTTMKTETFLIYIENGNIDIIVLKNHSREEAFEALNKIWKKHERQGKYYQYELMDLNGNTIFKNHLQ